nr:myosin-16-like [Bubalus bubalis]
MSTLLCLKQMTNKTLIVKKDDIQQMNPPKFYQASDMADRTFLNEASVLDNLRQCYVNTRIYTYSGLFCMTLSPIHGAHVANMYEGAPGLAGCGRGAVPRALVALKPVWWELGHGWSSVDLLRLSLLTPYLLLGPLTAWGRELGGEKGKFIRIHFGTLGKLAGADIESCESQPPALAMESLLLVPNLKEYHWVSRGITVVEAFDVLGFSAEKVGVYKLTGGHHALRQLADKVAHLMGVNFRELQKGITRPQVKVSNKFVQEGQNMEQCQNPIGALGKTVYDKMFKWLVVRINKTLDAKMQREFCTGTLDAAGFEIFEGYLASLCRSHPPLIRTFSPGFSRFSPSTWGQPISVCSWPPASGLQKVPSSCIGAKSQQFNSFEQLCISFTKKKLQQFSQHHIFALEQEVCKREGIQWVFTDFGLDLQACIDLLEKGPRFSKPTGIFSIFPKATNGTFKASLFLNHPVHDPRTRKVGYNITGWIEKNEDPLNESVVGSFQKSSLGILALLFKEEEALGSGSSKQPRASPKSHRATDPPGHTTLPVSYATGSPFTLSLVDLNYLEQWNKLMTTLHGTSPHPVCCIVPHEFKKSGAKAAHLIMHQLACNGILEASGFVGRASQTGRSTEFTQRYQVLNPNVIPQGFVNNREASELLLGSTNLDVNEYKIGHIKITVSFPEVFFRAGILARLEDMQDKCPTKIMTTLQRWLRGFLVRVEFKKMLERRMCLQVIQRNTRKFLQLRSWGWWKLYIKEHENLLVVEERLTPMMKAKTGLESQISNTTPQQRKVNRGVSSAEVHMNHQDLDKTQTLGRQALDHKVCLLTGDLSLQEDSIAKLWKEKRELEELHQETLDNLQAEDKVNHLTKTSSKLSSQIHKLEDNWKQEKKIWAEVEKARRKAESDLKITTDHLNEMERSKLDLQEVVKKREIEELKQELEADGAMSQGNGGSWTVRVSVIHLPQVEKEHSNLSRDLEGLSDRLEETGRATSAQKTGKRGLVPSTCSGLLSSVGTSGTETERLRGAGAGLPRSPASAPPRIELNPKREAELLQLWREPEEAALQSAVRRKHTDSMAELTEHAENLQRVKSKLEKDKQGMKAEMDASVETM